MTIPKNFLHDKVVLLLLTVTAFLAVLETILIILKLNAASGESYIIQYRSNLGLNAFKSGGALTLAAFIVYGWLIAVIHLLLSVRAYHIRRQISITVLSLGILLLLLAVIVSNSLLVLR